MNPDRRAGLLRRWFDRRSFGDSPTPFGIDWMLFIAPRIPRRITRLIALDAPGT